MTPCVWLGDAGARKARTQPATRPPGREPARTPHGGMPAPPDARRGSWKSLSEPLRDPGRLERVPAVRPRDLAAEPRRGHHLAWVGDPIRVERAAQLLERGE